MMQLSFGIYSRRVCSAAESVPATGRIAIRPVAGTDSAAEQTRREYIPKESCIMRHRNAGFKLGRNTSHRRALLRNLVTSVIIEDRVETTIAKAKAVRPHVEKMITLGKKGDLHSRRQALSFLMTDKAVARLFDTVAPRYGDRQGGYLRIVRVGFQQGDGAEKAVIELLGAEKQLEVKRQKRDEIKAKKRKELEDQLEAQKKEAEEKGGEEAA